MSSLLNTIKPNTIKTWNTRSIPLMEMVWRRRELDVGSSTFEYKRMWFELLLLLLLADDESLALLVWYGGGTPHVQENIKLYLEGCWKVGVPSADLFVCSDLYQRRGMPAVRLQARSDQISNQQLQSDDRYQYRAWWEGV